MFSSSEALLGTKGISSEGVGRTAGDEVHTLLPRALE